MIERARPMLRALGVVIAVWADDLCAQSPYEPLPPLPIGTVLLTLPSPHVPAAGSVEVRFGHRFGAADNDTSETLFGLDAGATVTLGVAWVPRRDLEIGLTRSNVLDTIELAGRYALVQQAPAIPLSLTFRTGVDWRGERNVDDRTSVFVQAMAARRLSSRLEVFLVPTWVTNAGRSAAGNTSVSTFEHVFNVPVGVAFLLGRDLSLVAEVIPPNDDLPDSADVGWSVGGKKAIGGHHFELMVTNSPAVTVDQYGSSSHQGSSLNASDVHVGFNISRRFGR